MLTKLSLLQDWRSQPAAALEPFLALCTTPRQSMSKALELPCDRFSLAARVVTCRLHGLVGQVPTAFILLRRAIVLIYINLEEIYLLASFEIGESNRKTLIIFGNSDLVHNLEFRIQVTGQAVGWCGLRRHIWRVSKPARTLSPSDQY